MSLKHLIATWVLAASLIAAASPFNAETARETARLRANRTELAKRKIDLLPVPKFITFKQEVTPAKVTLVIPEKAPYRKAIVEEISSRFKELDLKTAFQVSATPVRDAFNITVAAWDGKNENARKIPFTKDPRFDQAYTLTPVKNGMILSGRKDALYAAVTMRYLINNRNGKAVISTASIADWPDFAYRGMLIYSQYLLELAGSKDANKYLERCKPVIRFLLRNKINVCNGLVRKPYMPDRFPGNSLGSANELRNTRLVAEYALERGIRIGQMASSPNLASAQVVKKRPDLADYKKLMYVRAHRLYASWGAMDKHNKRAQRYADYVNTVKTGFYNFHSVDTGGAVDPEQWSQRDALTKKMFGDDRVKANAALLNAYFGKVKNPSTILSFYQYPYSAYLLEGEGIRRSLGLASSQTGKAQAAKLAERNIKFLKDLNKAANKRILFGVREDSAKRLDHFFRILPDRPLEHCWFTFELSRDIGSLVETDFASLRSAFRKERTAGDMINNYGLSGNELAAPAHVLFGEFSWNTAYPGCRDLDRDKCTPLTADPKFVNILAERISAGFFGEKAGPELKALFENLFSFYLTVDPTVLATRKNYNMPEVMKRNHQQLRKAEQAFDKVWQKVKKSPSMKKLWFKPGSYIYFVEYYRMIKAAVIHSTANLAVLEINAAAARGDLAATGKIYQKAVKEIASAKSKYHAKIAELKNEPVRMTFAQSYGWFRNSPVRMTSRLLHNDFSAPEKRLQSAWKNRQKMFETSYAPAWYKRANSRVASLEFTSAKPARVFAWHTQAGVPANRKIHVELSRDSQGLILKGKIYNKDLASIPVNTKDNLWKGDTFEAFFCPDGTKGKYFQFAFNQDGVRDAWEYVMVLRNPARITIPWHLETKRDKGFWTFTMKVPYKITGNFKGHSRALLACGNAYTGRVVKKRTNFHERALWNGISRPNAPTTPAFHITLTPGNIVAASKVHTSGAGTAVTLQPELNCSLPVDDASLSVRIVDLTGKVLAPWSRIAQREFVPCTLKAGKVTEIQLELLQNDFIVELKADYTLDGKKKTVIEKYLYGKNTKNISGVPMDLTGSLSPVKGRISFDFVPDASFSWKGYRGPVNDAWFFHAGVKGKGTSRPPWTNLICMGVSRDWGTCHLSICNKNYDMRRVSFQLPANWARSGKQRFECEWDLSRTPIRMTIKLNGKTVASEVHSRRKKDSSTMKLYNASYPVRVGSANNGAVPARGNYSNIHIK